MGPIFKIDNLISQASFTFFYFAITSYYTHQYNNFELLRQGTIVQV